MEASAPPRPDSAGLDYEALREELHRALSRTRLGRFAGEAALSEDDVVQEAIARLIAEVEGKGTAPRDPGAWLFRAATNYIKDRIKLDARHPTAPHEPGSAVFEGGDQAPAPEELVEARLSQAEYAHIRDRLDREEAALVVLREAGLTVRGAAEVLGKPKSSCQERLRAALDKIAAELASRRDEPADGRVRSLATAIVAGTLPASERAATAREMQYNLALRAEVSSLRHGLHEVATLIPLEEALARKETGHSLIERAALLVDRAREHAYSLVGRSSTHEAETAGGVVGGGAGASVAAKTLVAACIAGGGAVGVGGACVATGVVDLPSRSDQDQKPVAEKTVPQPQTTTPSTPTVAADPNPGPAEPAPSDQPVTTTEKPVQQVDQELYGGGSSSSGSSSGSRDFAAPVGSSSSSGGGGGGGGSGGSRENFGP
jgi:RNA polymerase sigma factor (sigma-70 family)